MTNHTKGRGHGFIPNFSVPRRPFGIPVSLNQSVLLRSSEAMHPPHAQISDPFFFFFLSRDSRPHKCTTKQRTVEGGMKVSVNAMVVSLIISTRKNIYAPELQMWTQVIDPCHKKKLKMSTSMSAYHCGYHVSTTRNTQ